MPDFSITICDLKVFVSNLNTIKDTNVRILEDRVTYPTLSKGFEYIVILGMIDFPFFEIILSTVLGSQDMISEGRIFQ